VPGERRRNAEQESLVNVMPDSGFDKRQVDVAELSRDDIVQLKDGRLVKFGWYAKKAADMSFDAWPVGDKFQQASVPNATKFDVLTPALAWTRWHKNLQNDAVNRGAGWNMERQISFEANFRAALVARIREQFLLNIPPNLEACAAEGQVFTTVRVSTHVPAGSAVLMSRLAEDNMPCSDGVMRSQSKSFIAWLLSKEDLVAHVHAVIPPHIVTAQVVQPCDGHSLEIKVELNMAP
jgi:hypothetical protein